MKTSPRFAFVALSLLGCLAASAATFQYDLTGVAGPGLRPGNEPGSITGGTGGEIGAGIFLDDLGDVDINTNSLNINVGWGSSQGFTDLSSAATNSHIHGPTASINGSGFTQTAGVLFTLTRSSNAVTGGTFTNSPLSLTAAQVTALNEGRYYINIHTTNNGGGELRGFIVAVPEPSRVMFALIGFSLVVLRRKR
jgi:hypothetical protein